MRASILFFEDEEKGYQVKWLVPESNEKEIEPVYLTLSEHGAFKQFEPSLSETFAYVLEGQVTIKLGKKKYIAKKRRGNLFPRFG